MPLAAPKFIGNASKRPHLLGRQEPSRDLSANHLHAQLPLAVDPTAQPERPKLIVGKLAAQVQLRLLTKQFNVLTDSSIVLLLSNLEIGQYSGGHRYPSL